MTDLVSSFLFLVSSSKISAQSAQLETRNQKPETILIMAGGTGGHVFPGLAVAEYLRNKGWRVIWMGTRTGMEAQLVPSRNFEMCFVRFSGLRGKGLLRMMLLPTNLLIAFWQSARHILRFKPNVVLGMGGYISFPGGLMACLLGKPLILHEQNSIAGLANKVLAQIADKVLVAFPNSLANSQYIGNPVRGDIANLASPAERFKQRQGSLKLLVVGGSLGAQILNEIVPVALKLLPSDKRPWTIHQSGVKHIDALRANYAQAGVKAELVPFIDNMAVAYRDADVVICRAGAMTIAEITAAGVASILVPFPHAVDDHQTYNAKFLSDKGAALLLPQKELTAEKLAGLLQELSREKLLQMAMRARELAKPEATKMVAEVCMELVRG